MESFQYDPLDLETRSFRLLRLHRGRDKEEIECDIVEAFLDQDDTVPFEALSYVWGSLDMPRSIRLNRKHLNVTTNLEIALQNLRVEHEDRILWVDAVCIDQNNVPERGHQVIQMGSIYSLAERVIFWLGESTPYIDPSSKPWIS